MAGAKTRHHHNVAIERLASDEWANVTTEATTTSTTYVDGATLTFTPASTGTYYVLMRAVITNDTTSKTTAIRMYDGTTGYGELRMQVQGSTSENRTWTWLQRFTSVSGSTTYKIQFQTASGGTARLKEQCIWAFREDEFEDAQHHYYSSNQTTTSTTFVDTSSTHTFTPAATGRDYLLLTTAIVRGGNHATYRGHHKFIVDGTDKGETAIKAGTANSSSNRYAYFYAEVVNFDNTSKTLKYQYKRSGSGIGANATIGPATIVALRIPEAAAIADRVISIGGTYERAGTRFAYGG